MLVVQLPNNVLMVRGHLEISIEDIVGMDASLEWQPVCALTHWLIEEIDIYQSLLDEDRKRQIMTEYESMDDRKR